ncbi:unnamed protein product [Prunus brigantina]
MPSPMIASFTTPRKQNKLSNASIASMVNIGDEAPNSITSFSYRCKHRGLGPHWSQCGFAPGCKTSSSETLAVITNTESEYPREFKMISSPWLIPFACVMIGKYTWSFVEFLWSGGTILGWWNDQRMWLYKRTSSLPLSLR